MPKGVQGGSLGLPEGVQGVPKGGNLDQNLCFGWLFCGIARSFFTAGSSALAAASARSSSLRTGVVAPWPKAHKRNDWYPTRAPDLYQARAQGPGALA